MASKKVTLLPPPYVDRYQIHCQKDLDARRLLRSTEHPQNYTNYSELWKPHQSSPQAVIGKRGRENKHQIGHVEVVVRSIVQES